MALENTVLKPSLLYHKGILCLILTPLVRLQKGVSGRFRLQLFFSHCLPRSPSVIPPLHRRTYFSDFVTPGQCYAPFPRSAPPNHDIESCPKHAPHVVSSMRATPNLVALVF